MTHPVRPFVLLVCSGLLVVGLVSLAGCKKDTDPQAVPVPSGAAIAAPPPSAAAEAAQAASASANASASAAPTTPPPVVQQASIDGCCAALASAGKATKSTSDKDKLLQASKICSGIAAKVKAGQSQRASALVTIRSQLGGVGTPSECH